MLGTSMTPEIYPSLISADLLALREVIDALEPVADGFHLDVMDFHFVPNLTFGPAFIHAISRVTKKPLHVHVMVDDPLQWTQVLTLRACDVFVFHYEATRERKKIMQVIDAAKGIGCGVGMAINPNTPPDVLFEYLPHLAQALIMSVEPGFSGQKFMPQVQAKLPVLQEHITKQALPCKIAMDGGIAHDNIALLAGQGVSIFAIASAIFGKPDPAIAVQELRQLVSR